MHSVVTRDCAVHGLRQHRLVVGALQHTGHQPERAEALRHHVAHDVPVVVLASPHKPPLALDAQGHHVVDEAVLVRDPHLRELALPTFLVHLQENVLESPVVLLVDCVLGGQIQRQPLLVSHCHGSLGKRVHAGLAVEHSHGHAAPSLQIAHLQLARFRSVGRGEHHLHFARHVQHHFARHGVVPVGMPGDDDGLLPAWHRARHVAQYHGLAEHGAVEEVADATAGGVPHPLQAKLLHARLVGGDGGALDGHVVLERRQRRLPRHLVAGLVTFLNGQVKIHKVHFQEGMDELALDHVPDHVRHLIAIHLHDGIFHIYFRHGFVGIFWLHQEQG
mmetsp:Transcript_4757/g.8982  ORF Transcript_4757/g.8982 Transcript_4757/m.8982 type:complete len:333 (+) Transcript_4757:725-1723(+)